MLIFGGKSPLGVPVSATNVACLLRLYLYDDPCPGPRSGPCGDDPLVWYRHHGDWSGGDFPALVARALNVDTKSGPADRG